MVDSVSDRKPSPSVWDLNPEIRYLGHEQTPLVIIDDPPFETEALRNIAAHQALFNPDNQTFYPGVRSVLPAEYGRELIRLLEPMIRDLYRVPSAYGCRCTRQLYSLVTTPESDLQVLQRVPHFDTRWPSYFAIMHYLNPGDFGGTGFFRHKPTGFERITDERFDEFRTRANQYMENHGAPPARYCRQSDSHFEMIDAVDYRENRLVIYPGNLLHTALIDPERDISADPSTGRLTANLFLDFVPRD